MGAASTPRPRAAPSLRPATWLPAAALLWSVLLIGSAFVVPVYSGASSTPDGGFVETSATMIEVNGPSVLIPMAIPAAVCALVWLLLHLASRGSSSWGHRAASILAWLLAAFAFVTGFSIGLMVLPAAVALLAAVALARQ